MAQIDYSQNCLSFQPRLFLGLLQSYLITVSPHLCGLVKGNFLMWHLSTRKRMKHLSPIIAPIVSFQSFPKVFEQLKIDHLYRHAFHTSILEKYVWFSSPTFVLYCLTQTKGRLTPSPGLEKGCRGDCSWFIKSIWLKKATIYYLLSYEHMAVRNLSLGQEIKS